MLLFFGFNQSEWNGILLILTLLLVAFNTYKNSEVSTYINNRFLRRRDLNKVAKEKSSEFASCGLISFDEKDCIVAWNKAAYITFKWKEREVLEKNINLLIAKDSMAAFKSFKDEHIHGYDHSVLELEACTKDKKKIPIELSISKWVIDNSTIYTIVTRDISHRKGNEASRKVVSDNIIREQGVQLELYRHSEDVDQTGAWRWNLTEQDEHEAFEVTEGVRKIFLIGRTDNLHDFLIKKVHHNDQHLINEALDKAKRGEDSEFTYRAIRSDYSIALIFCKWRMALTSPKPSTPTDIYGTIRLLQIISNEEDARNTKLDK